MVAAALAFPAAAQQGLKVPSGQYILPYEFLWEDHRGPNEKVETWLILRFLAPDIGKTEGKLSFDDVIDDLDRICTTVGLPVARLAGGAVDQVVVNLMNKPINRGQRDASITQYMNAYRIVGGRCTWD